MTIAKPFALALAALTFSASAARADGGAPDIDMSVVLGLGTPLGMLGFELQGTLTGQLALSGGIGIGPGGLAVSVQPRIFQRPDRSGFYAGLGLSLSQEDFSCPAPQPDGGDGFDDLCFDPKETGNALWVNAEVGYQGLIDDTILVRGFFGASQMLNARDVCADTSAGCLDTLPYAGLAFGYGGGRRAHREAEPEPAPVTPTNDVLLDDAREAAMHDRCDVVRVIDTRLASVDPDFRNRVFAVDPTIASCLAQ